jgi:hypothetical protein
MSPYHPALWTIAGLIEARLGDHGAAKSIFEMGIDRFKKFV